MHYIYGRIAMMVWILLREYFFVTAISLRRYKERFFPPIIAKRQIFVSMLLRKVIFLINLVNCKLDQLKI